MLPLLRMASGMQTKTKLVLFILSCVPIELGTFRTRQLDGDAKTVHSRIWICIELLRNTNR